MLPLSIIPSQIIIPGKFYVPRSVTETDGMAQTLKQNSAQGSLEGKKKTQIGIKMIN